MITAPAVAHTIEEWLQQSEEDAFELIDGRLRRKAMPDEAHSRAQVALIQTLAPEFNRTQGPRGLGGWWIRSELDVSVQGHGFRPDVCGFRRDRVPSIPPARPVTLVPEWICEIVSESNASTDTVLKLHRYAAAGVAHYWLVVPASEQLLVFRITPSGLYENILAAGRGDRVRAEPFEAIAFQVGVLFGDEPAPAPDSDTTH